MARNRAKEDRERASTPDAVLMPPAVRRLALTAHIATSVGWMGAVVAFLPVAIVARVSRDHETVRGAYLAMELIGSYALVPLAFAALLSGFVQSLGTRWGLIRHYWVLFKLGIGVLSTLLLLSYTRTLGFLAGVAAELTAADAVTPVLRSHTAVVHAGLALFALLVATALSVYKPEGLTPYGRRKARGNRLRPFSGRSREVGDGVEEPAFGAGVEHRPGPAAPLWVKAFGIAALTLILLLGLLVFAGGGDHGPRRHAPPAGTLREPSTREPVPEVAEPSGEVGVEHRPTGR